METRVTDKLVECWWWLGEANGGSEAGGGGRNGAN